jgi:hypothetical protein
MSKLFISPSGIDGFCDDDYSEEAEGALTSEHAKVIKFPAIEKTNNTYVEGGPISNDDSYGQEFFSIFSSFPSPPQQDFLDLCASKFRRSARSEPLEYGVFSRCDELVESWIHEYGDKFGTLLGHLYLNAINDSEVALALLKAVSMLSWDTVYPHGQMLALAATGNSNLELSDACIRAFENWEDKRGIGYLEQTAFREQWLEDYKKEVMLNLDGI